MKKSFWFILSAILLAIIAFCKIYCCGGDGPKPPCDLPAPQNLTVQVVPIDSALLEWDTVAGAVGYRIVVIDTTDADTVGVFDTTLPELGLDSLEANHGYEAEVWAKCSSEIISKNSAKTNWQQSIIIIDEVVMMPCGCGNTTTWPNSPASGNSTISLTGFSFSANPNERLIYQLRIVNGSSSKLVYLAYDNNGCNIIKFQYPRDQCGEGENIVATNKTTYIEFTLGGTAFLNVTPTDLLGHLDLVFLGGGTYQFHHRKCGGAWTGTCN